MTSSCARQSDRTDCPEIRALTCDGSDVDEVVRLAAELSLEEDPDQAPPDRETVLCNLEAEIGEDVAHWGAWSGSRLVGMAEYRRSTDGRAGDRIGMFVSRSCRRHSVGRSLLHVLAAHARRCGRARLVCSTIDEVDGGATFCRRIGATPAIVEKVVGFEVAGTDPQQLQVRAASFAAAAPHLAMVVSEGIPHAHLDGLAELLNAIGHELPSAEAITSRTPMTPERLLEAWSSERDHRVDLVVHLARHRASGDVVGYARSIWDRSAPEHVTGAVFAVRPEHRSAGVARWLLTEQLAWAHARGVATIRAQIASANIASFWTCAAVGFRTCQTMTTWDLTVQAAQTYLQRVADRVS